MITHAFHSCSTLTLNVMFQHHFCVLAFWHRQVPVRWVFLIQKALLMVYESVEVMLMLWLWTPRCLYSELAISHLWSYSSEDGFLLCTILLFFVGNIEWFWILSGFVVFLGDLHSHWVASLPFEGIVEHVMHHLRRLMTLQTLRVVIDIQIHRGRQHCGNDSSLGWIWFRDASFFFLMWCCWTFLVKFLISFTQNWCLCISLSITSMFRWLFLSLIEHQVAKTLYIFALQLLGDLHLVPQESWFGLYSNLGGFIDIILLFLVRCIWMGVRGSLDVRLIIWCLLRSGLSKALFPHHRWFQFWLSRICLRRHRGCMLQRWVLRLFFWSISETYHLDSFHVGRLLLQIFVEPPVLIRVKVLVLTQAEACGSRLDWQRLLEGAMRVSMGRRFEIIEFALVVVDPAAIHLISASLNSKLILLLLLLHLILQAFIFLLVLLWHRDLAGTYRWELLRRHSSR